MNGTPVAFVQDYHGDFRLVTLSTETLREDCKFS